MGAVHRALEWRDASADDRVRYRELERSVISQAALVRDACHSEPCTEAGLTSAFTAFLDCRLPGAAGHAAPPARHRAGAGEGDRHGRRRLPRGRPGGDAARARTGAAAGAAAPAGEMLTGLDRVLAMRHPDVVFELLSSMPGLADAALWSAARTSASTAADIRAA